MSDIFLSDLHYGAFDEATDQKIESDLLSLIDYCEKHQIRIHILGDLFDYWMEYPEMVPEFGNQILNRFASFHKNNPATLYITGNHDNWTQGAFEESGFDVEPEYRILTVGDTLVFLHHGDGLDAPEFRLKRPLLHRILRNRWFVRLFQALFPPDTGLALMKTFSRLSRFRSRPDPTRLNRWAKSFLATSRIEMILCGHDHIARMETFDFGRYINLGTFSENRTLAIHTNGQFELVTWDSGKKKLVSAVRPDHPVFADE